MSFIQDHRIARKQDLANHSVVKWHKVAQTVAVIDFVRETAAKNLLRICII